MLMIKRNKKNIFEKIDDYLYKKGHSMCLALILDSYNGNFIYVRLDYVEKLKAYKMVWIDLKYINEKYIGDYINSQLVTSYIANRLIDLLEKMKVNSESRINENILGDRVTFINYIGEESKEYTFSRFLPKDWDFLIDPLVLIFSYLPRSMEVFLNEIFGIIDGVQDEYNAKKAIKFNMLDDLKDDVFSAVVRRNGKKLFEEGKVKFLEKVDSRFLAVIDLPEPVLVVLHQVNKEFVFFWCSCEKHLYCEHIYAALLALRKEQFKEFYKVAYRGNKRTLLDKIRDGIYYLCLGEKDGNLILVSENAELFLAPIIENRTCMFDVIEDDDECSLSKIINKYQDE